jgi:hypothetical protein
LLCIAITSPSTATTRLIKFTSSCGESKVINISALEDCPSASDLDQREGNTKAVRQFVHQHAVARDQRRVHRGRWNIVPVRHSRSEHHHQTDEGKQKPFVLTPESLKFAIDQVLTYSVRAISLISKNSS